MMERRILASYAWRLVLVVAIVSSGRSSVPAQTLPTQSEIPLPTDSGIPIITVTLPEIAALAQTRNLTVRRANLEVERARLEMDGESSLVDTELSIGGDYRQETRTGETWSAVTGVSVPIVPQLSVGAEATFNQDAETEESLSVRVRPLAPRRATWRETQSFQSAVIRRDAMLRSLALQAETAALTVTVRDAEQRLAADVLDLEQRKYDLLLRQREIGEASFQDIQDQQVALIEARQAFFDSRRRYASDWNALQRLFAPSEEHYTLRPVDRSSGIETVEIDALIETRRGRVAALETASPTTEDVRLLEVELAALEGQLSTIPRWRPDLDLTAGVAFPDSSADADPTTRAGITLTVSPNQFRADEQDELRDEIEVTRMDLVAERYAAELDSELLAQSVTIGEQARAAADLQEERDRLALREGTVRFQQGGRTNLEIEQLRINLRRAGIRAYQAAVDLYGSLGAYLATF